MAEILMEKKRKELLEKGFSTEQVNEIAEGIKEGIDVSLYAATEFDPIQMRQIRLGQVEKLPVKLYARKEFDCFQMEEVRKGLEEKLNINLYALPDIPYDKMRQIRKGLEQGVDLTEYLQYKAGIIRQLRKAIEGKVDLVPYVKEGYNEDQLEQIRIALEKGIYIRPYITKDFRGVSIRQIRKGLEKGIDVSPYATLAYGWQQMQEIRIGLENRIDIQKYVNPLYSWRQMREIRLGLQAGIDVSSYTGFINTALEMSKKRTAIMESIGHTAQQDKIKTESASGKTSHDKEIETPEVDLHSGISITISQDEMQAYVQVEKDSAVLSYDEIVNALNQNGITMGICKDAIKDIVLRKNVSEPALVAEGKLPVDGEDGWYEYYFTNDTSKCTVFAQDESIDFDKSIWIQVVKANQKIADYHCATPGENGFTVSGKTLLAKNGQEKSVLTGKGFKQIDSKTYVAEFDGKIEFGKDQLEVSKLLILDNVKTAAGPLEYDGSIYVKGSVGRNTVIKATGDLIVEGHAGPLTVECDGNVVFVSGINAFGNGSIKAGKNVAGKFLEAIDITAGGDIVTNHCIKCKLYSEANVIIYGQKGQISGGDIYARKGFKAWDVGSYNGMGTIIKLGVDDSMLQSVKTFTSKISELKNDIDTMLKVYKGIQIKFKPEVYNSMDSYKKIENAVVQKKKQLDKMRDVEVYIKRQIKDISSAKAVIKGTIGDNVMININGRSWKASNLSNVTVEEKEHKIVAVNCEETEV